MCWYNETYVHTTNDDGHVATTSKRDDRTVLVDQRSELVYGAGKEKKVRLSRGGVFSPTFASRSRDALDEYTHFSFGIGFRQNHVAGGPGGSETLFLCSGYP